MFYGAARITAIDLENRSFVRDVFEGDLWYFPTGIPHSIQGLGPDGAEFLLFGVHYRCQGRGTRSVAGIA